LFDFLQIIKFFRKNFILLYFFILCAIINFISIDIKRENMPRGSARGNDNSEQSSSSVTPTTNAAD
jgi:hypothetical protein